jgi:hypothetical protein
MTDLEAKRIFIGAFTPGTTNIIIPTAALQRAERILDAEREARLKAAALARSQGVQAARSRSRLKKALTSVFRRRSP